MYPRMPSHRLACLSMLGLMALVRSSSQENLCEVKTSGNAEALGGRYFINNIQENIAVGGPLAHLAIEGTEPDISLTVIEADDHFSFDPQSRNISVVKQLWISQEADRRRQMTIGCTIVRRSTTFSPVGAPVISTLLATDADPDNSLINYHIVPGNYSSYFDIPNPARGEIVLKKVLDYETIQVLNVEVAAVDSHPDASNHFSSTVSVTVRVIDEDDQNPRFRETLYEATVGERAPAVTQVNNNDRYSSALVPVRVKGVNEHKPQFINDRQGAALSYSLEAGGDATMFSIDPKTGLIKTTKPLDYETTTQYNLTVHVTDGKHNDHMVVTVDVVDTNDNNPVFSQKEYVFRAYSPAKDNNLLGTLRDAGSMFTFSILGNQTLFSINGAGEVRLTGEPATLSKGSYELFLVVRDNGEPHRQDSAVVIIVANAVSGQVEQAPNQEMNMVAIILLSVVCGCLLLIIAILVVYIYKNGKQDPPTNFVKSKSFEGDMNLQGEGYKSYYDDEAEGVAYSPKSRHLAMYNDIPAEAEDSTTPQENPFTGTDNAAYRSSITPRFMQGGVRGSCTYTTRSSNSRYVYVTEKQNVHSRTHRPTCGLRDNRMPHAH
ncbi:hypothetical protein NP493_716g00016 [Ridgeia piscesae]|uniref:Cadherin domain-containing protein n=1 Tax=Ridgeia piscesae TaxID=27915 RepID=A0AAD9KQ69_RIDPI|nr:hypothetical protein NP493_716g00016 [Ridgeia piscesae]